MVTSLKGVLSLGYSFSKAFSMLKKTLHQKYNLKQSVYGNDVINKENLMD